MKYKKTDNKGHHSAFPVKIVEKGVPFNKEGERMMYHFRPIKQGVIESENLAR